MIPLLFIPLIMGFSGVAPRGQFFYPNYDSLNTRFVGNWPFGYCSAVTLDTTREIAFIRMGGGVFILDLSEPLSPIKIGEIRTRGIVGFLYYQDSTLYITNQGDKDIAVWDIRIPNRPIKIASIPLRLSTIFIRGHYLYGTDRDSFRVFDISNPEHPVQLGSLVHPYGAITVVDSFAFITPDPFTRDSGISIINIADPAAPYKVGEWKKHTVNYLAVAGGYAYCITDTGLWIVDISNPGQPVEVGFSQIECQVIHLSNATAYVGTTTGIAILDVHNPAKPVIISCLEGGYPTDLKLLSDSLLCVTNQVFSTNSGFCFVNVKDLRHPFLFYRYRVPGWAAWVEIAGDYAYVCEWDYGLRVLDISDPGEPTEVSQFITEHGSHHIVVSDTIGYLCDFGKGLRILNLANPTAPVEIGFCSTPGAANACAISGSYAYVADGLYGLRVIDVRNPYTPYEVGNIDTPGYAWFVDVNESLAYVADEYQGLRVINIRNPAAPYEIGAVLLSNQPVVVKVKDSFAYVGGFDSNMVIVNIADPVRPRPSQVYQTNGPCWGIDISYPYAYVSDWFVKFHIVDITNPLNPVLAGYHWAPNCPYGLRFVSPYVYVTTGLCGLQIYESLLPGIEERQSKRTLERELTIYPNPARQLFMVNTSNIINSVQLYDIAGKLIRRYRDINADNQFSVVGIPAGVYLVKIQTEDNSAIRKLIVR